MKEKADVIIATITAEVFHIFLLVSYLVVGGVEFALIAIASKLLMKFCVFIGIENDLTYQVMSIISSLGSIILYLVFTIAGLHSIVNHIKKPTEDNTHGQTREPRDKNV